MARGLWPWGDRRGVAGCADESVRMRPGDGVSPYACDDLLTSVVNANRQT